MRRWWLVPTAMTVLQAVRYATGPRSWPSALDVCTCTESMVTAGADFPDPLTPAQPRLCQLLPLHPPWHLQRMPHTLYTFGLALPPHAPAPTTPFLPQRTRQARRIKVLWKSWCDSVIAYEHVDDVWTVEYAGLGLTTAQRERLDRSAQVRAAVGGEACAIRLFGSVMHDGLRGFVLSHNELDAPEPAGDKVIVFSTDLERYEGAPEWQEYAFDKDYQLADIQLCSGGDVLISLCTRSTGLGRILHVRDFATLRAYLASGSSIPHEITASFLPRAWSLSSTTATAVNDDGEVFTYTRDPRYPKCLGRPSEDANGFQPVPYLSETPIVSVASGGYMTAVVSADGELFVWGQACPGSGGELNVLGDTTTSTADNSTSADGSKRSWIAGISEQDEFVKCLNVYVAGKEAAVSGVAVGSGHMLVAAEVPEAAGGEKAVLAAGQGSDGQLGLGTNLPFQGEFEEILALRGKHVIQLATAGWSSSVVVSE